MTMENAHSQTELLCQGEKGAFVYVQINPNIKNRPLQIFAGGGSSGVLREFTVTYVANKLNPTSFDTRIGRFHYPPEEDMIRDSGIRPTFADQQLTILDKDAYIIVLEDGKAKVKARNQILS